MARISPEWLRKQLAKLPSERGLTFNGDQALVRCHNVEHSGGNERHASMTINIEKPNAPPGIWGCWSCGASGNYEALVKAYPNVLELPMSGSSEALKAFENTGVFLHPDTIESSARVELPDLKELPDWPESAVWRRSVDGTTIARYGGKLAFHAGRQCLYLPVHVFEDYVGGVYAVLERKDKKTKAYINTPGPWSAKALFGYDQARWAGLSKKPVWVAEGPRDTLRLASADQRAVGLLGKAVTKAKQELLLNLDAPFYLLATDADEAGRSARMALIEAFRNSNVPYFTVKMDEGSDPADLSISKIQSIADAAYDMWRKKRVELKRRKRA